MSLPKSVPIFSAKHMCIGPYHDGKKRCILGWCDDIGVSFDDPIIGESCRELGIFGGCTSYCDEGHVTLKQAARAMNRITARLGYVINNPECTQRGKLRKVHKKDMAS